MSDLYSKVNDLKKTLQHKNLNLERMTIDQYTGVIVDNLEKIVVFGKVR